MKATLILLFVFLNLHSFGQTDSAWDKAEGRTDIWPFIKGHKYEKYISIDQIKNGFEVELSDTTYKIRRFLFCWLSKDDILYNKVILNNKVPGEFHDASLRNALTESFFTIEMVLAEKKGKLYKLPSIVVYTTEPGKIAGIYDTLAKNKAYLAGSKNQLVVPVTFFKKNFSIALFDTSYRIISFTITFAFSIKDEEEKSFHMDGNTVDISKAGFKEASEKLFKNDVVIFENIMAEKNGKVYRVPDFEIYTEK